MFHKLGKRLIGSALAFFVLAGMSLLNGCGTSAPITITFVTPSPLPSATAGMNYTTSIHATGLTGPPTGVYQFSIVAGQFPGFNGTPANGTLKIATVNTLGTNDKSDAVISGTPTRPGTYTFIIQATDSLNPPTVATAQYTLTVNP
jgi:hypothetical protein